MLNLNLRGIFLKKILLIAIATILFSTNHINADEQFLPACDAYCTSGFHKVSYSEPRLYGGTHGLDYNSLTCLAFKNNGDGTGSKRVYYQEVLDNRPNYYNRMVKTMYCEAN